MRQALNTISLRWKFMIAPLIGVVMTTVLAAILIDIAQDQSDLLKKFQEDELKQTQEIISLSHRLASNHAGIYELLHTATPETSEGVFYDSAKPYLHEIHQIDAELIATLQKTGDDIELFRIITSLEEGISQYRIITTNALLMATVDMSLAQKSMSNATKQFNQLNAELVGANQFVQTQISEHLARAQKIADGRMKTITLLYIFMVLILLVLSSSLSRILSYDLKQMINRLSNLVSRGKKPSAADSKQTSEIITLSNAIEGVRESYEALDSARADLKSLNTALEQKVEEQHIIISEQRKAEKARDKALTEARRANKAKSEFLAMMSHEFRTPLNAILGFSDMLSAQYFGPLGSRRYKEYVEDIHLSGEHLLSLVNDVLDISAIEAGKRQIIREAIQLNDILNECIKKVEHYANHREVSLNVKPVRKKKPIFADKTSIAQIILNLLTNAIKFSDKQSQVFVAITSWQKTITISVKDSGVGIPEEKIPALTDPFVQAIDDPYRAQEGLGLGLSIVNSLVKAHGGTLIIDSKVGKGTTVSVKLPDIPPPVDDKKSAAG